MRLHRAIPEEQQSLPTCAVVPAIRRAVFGSRGGGSGVPRELGKLLRYSRIGGPFMGESKVKGAKKQTAPLSVSGTHIVYGSMTATGRGSLSCAGNIIASASCTATGRGFLSCAATVIAASVTSAVARHGPGAVQRAEEATLFGMPPSELAAVIRRKNRLVGPTIDPGWRLMFVGECRRPKLEHADVFLFFGGEDDEAGFVSDCRQVYAASPRRIVMLNAGQVRLSTKHLLVLKGHGVSAITLTKRHATKGWKLPWDELLGTKSAVRAAHAEGQRQAPYCRVITHRGTRTVNLNQYTTLVKDRRKHDMFIDGVTGEVFVRLGKTKTREARLTAMERGILIDFVEARRPMTPRRTETGRRCASEMAALALFRTARAKADMKLKRYEHRAFRLRRSPASPELNTFEFAPPKSLMYCVIVPV